MQEKGCRCNYSCGSLAQDCSPFISLPPYLWALPRPSLASPTLRLIKQCQAFNKSLTGVTPWTALFIKGLHCWRVLKSDWSHRAPVCPSAWLTSDARAARGRQPSSPGAPRAEGVFVVTDHSACSISLSTNQLTLRGPASPNTKHSH